MPVLPYSHATVMLQKRSAMTAMSAHAVTLPNLLVLSRFCCELASHPHLHGSYTGDPFSK